MPLTLEEVRKHGVIDELARRFADDRTARVLLDRVKFPRQNIPNNAANPQDFWETVADEIDSGLIQDGFDALLRAASETYRYNPVFSSLAPPDRPPSAPPAGEREMPSGKGGANIAVRNCHDVHLVIDAARRLAAQHHLPGVVEPAYHSAGTLMISLPQMTAEQAMELARLLQTEMQARRYDFQFSSAAAEFRDYLISPVYVEGPDQARFELTNVPASTRVREIAQGIMGQYSSDLWEKDKSGRPRSTVVDQLTDDGTTRRLDPDSTLHDNGIVDNSRLHVAPESTAGIHPHYREEALRRVFLEVVDYARKHPTFEVEADNQHAPTEYLFRFQAPGWGPPVVEGGPPVLRDEHEIFVAMPAEFPMEAPEAFCQTPIFHPNVDRKQKSGYVCLGALQDHYRPGEDFGRVMQLLYDMVIYDNYNLEEVLDDEARDWAMTPEGMAAIEQRGGRSYLRLIAAMYMDARPLEIKRA